MLGHSSQNTSNIPLFDSLSNENKYFIIQKANEFNLTYQDKRNLTIIALDFEMWDIGLLKDIWDQSGITELKGKNRKQKVLSRIREYWLSLKYSVTDYPNTDISDDISKNGLPIPSIKATNGDILGWCPVASPKTRCCNLRTLDVVINCGFSCNYCSIQHFYHNNSIYIQRDLQKRLDNLNLSKDTIHHIGTGQSSDSLMWGNNRGLLDTLFKFAYDNPHVILELKSKSSNTSYLEKNEIPHNILITWSLNTDIIISNEEKGTAPLNERIDAAKRIADKGALVGFHFHPIIYYKGWKKDYTEIVHKLLDLFSPEQVAMVSLGTLTFIKPIIHSLRKHKIKTRTLQIPLEPIEGKYSYSFNIKKELFSTLYREFSQWHDNVFFYMCMEDKNLWLPVFGREYDNNEEFELDMKNFYMEKIKNIT